MRRTDGLTGPQREALELAAQGLSSKEIGRQLGLSHHAVDRRIDRAVAAIGAGDRREAARIFRSEAAYEPLTYEPSPLADPMVTAKDVGAETARGFPWPFATLAWPDGLPLGARLFWALLGVPVIVMVAIGMLLSAIASLDTLKL